MTPARAPSCPAVTQAPPPAVWPSRVQARAAVPVRPAQEHPTRVNQLTQPLAELGPMQPAVFGGEQMPASRPANGDVAGAPGGAA